MRRRNSEAGLTIIELLIIISIIGIIVSVAIPFFQHVRDAELRKADPNYDQRVQTEARQQEQDTVAQRIHYIRDNRTGLCFAYYWGGDHHGGPALTEVSCDKVTDFLPQNSTK